MVYNYIIKSFIETVIMNEKEFSKVEKDVSTNPLNALEDYEKHLSNNLNSIILKRNKRNNWEEITVSELKKDLQGAKKLPGLRKAFKVKSGWK